MSEFFAPGAEQVKNLLAECGLPSEDLDDGSDVRFIASGPVSEPIAIAGLELYLPYGLLRSVAVSAAARGTGVGKMLVGEIEGLARLRRLNALYLLTTTAPDFFCRLGYSEVNRGTVPEEIKRSSEFASVCPDDAIVMVKNLRDEHGGD